MEFGGFATYNCPYGGLQLMNYHQQRNLRIRMDKHIELRHYPNRHSVYRGQAEGEICTRFRSYPLVGEINHLHMSKGVTFLVLFALPPYYKITLTMKFEKTRCEGLFNLATTHCRTAGGMLTRSIYTPTYRVQCMEMMAIYVLLLHKVCIVVQNVHVGRRRAVQVKYYTTSNSMHTQLSLVSTARVPYRGSQIICQEWLNTVYRSSDAMLLELRNTYGEKFGERWHNTVQNYNITEVIIQYHGVCKGIPMIYYAFQVSNFAKSTNRCAKFALGTPEDGRRNSFSEYEGMVVGSCAQAVLHTYRGFYSMYFVKSLMNDDQGGLSSFQSYYIRLDASCSNNTDIRIYLTEIQFKLHRFKTYKVFVGLMKYIMSFYTKSVILSFDVLRTTTCMIWVSYNRYVTTVKTPRKRRCITVRR